MFTRESEFEHGVRSLRHALEHALTLISPLGSPLVVPAATDGAGPDSWRAPRATWLAVEATSQQPQDRPGGYGGYHDADLATSAEADEAEASRLIGLVELARGGDSEAFGMLYDHYHVAVYRFLYYRLGSVALAEDLTSETFFRALRSVGSFRWQGKDFGAWLMTIARNLTADHFKSSRNRLEVVTDHMSAHDAATEGPESSVLASLTNEALLTALRQLPAEQQECLIMRFLQGLSIAETAQVLGRTNGAVKQLQLRAVRNLAKLLPEGLR
ncbi:hypothetical protein BH18ACT9_BH18ACT9_07410 [soil metagenome]